VRFNIIIAIFLILATLYSAGDVEINRPWNEGTLWEHGNSYISDIPLIGVVYNPCIMSKPLLDMDLQAVKLLNISDDAVEKKVSDAYTYSRLYTGAASEMCDRCNAYYISVGPLPVIVIDRDSLEWRFVEFEDIHCVYYALSFEEQRKNWKSAMDNALDALELSIEKSDEKVEKAREVFSDLEHAGICDEDYRWKPNDACSNLSVAVAIVNNGTLEGSYGKINILHNYYHILNDQLWNDLPNTTLYYPMMELVWGRDGILETYDALIKAGEDAKIEAVDIYNRYKYDVENVKESVDKGYSDLKKEQLEKIDVPVAQEEEINLLSRGTIAERYEILTDEKENAEKLYEYSKHVFSDKEMEGYLKYSTMNMSAAKERYEFLEQAMDLLLEDARKVVEDARREAQEKINSAESRESVMGSAGKEMLKNAKNEFEKGEQATSLGSKYSYYIKAAQFASAAVLEKSFEQEADIQVRITEIEDLLKRAEQDGINVASERAELEMLSNNRDIPNILSRLDSLKKRIIEKASIVYGDLENQHTQLLERLELAGAEDLLEEMREAEAGLFVDGKIDYEKALGKLRWLRSKYDSIEEKLEEDLDALNKLVANSIITDTSLIIDKVKIDEPTKFSLNILLRNTKDYSGEDVTVSVDISEKFNFGYSDITEGREDISGLQAQANRLLITLKSIGPYETKSITFEKSEVLARRLSETKSGVGLGDGSARVAEKTVFDLLVDDAYVEVPESSAASVTIDGLSASRPLSKGVHALNRTYILEDAYEEEREPIIAAMPTGRGVVVTHSITITPHIDLDSVPVFIDFGGRQHISDISVECGQYDCKVGNNRIDIFNLMKDSPVTMTVSYSISNLSSYVDDELKRYENSTTEPEIVALLNEAKTLAGAGNYQAALQKIEELKKKNSELEKSKSKLMREYSELMRSINRELADLDSAINKAEQLNVSNSSLIDRFKARKTQLSDLIKQYGNISSSTSISELEEAIEQIKKIDEKWLGKEISSFKNDAVKQLNNYRKNLAGFENDSANDLLELLEHDINVLAATEKAESAVQVLADLKTLEETCNQLEESIRAQKEELGLLFQSLKEDAEEILSIYSRESKNAKGTSAEQLFTINENSVSRLISSIQNEIATKDIPYIKNKLKELEKMKDGMEKILNAEKNQAEEKLAGIKSVFSEKKDYISENDRNVIADEIVQMEQLIGAGQNANALRKGDTIIAKINSAQKGSNNFALLLLASVLVVVIAIIYIIKQQHEKKPKIKILKDDASEEK